MKYSVSTEPPEGFNPTVEVAGCYCEWTDRILFLKRHPEKVQGGMWGVPAGKMEKNETPQVTVIREVHEEVGLNINDGTLKVVGQLYCCLPHVHYVYHMFRKRFTLLPEVTLELKEHLEMRWVTLEEAFTLPLIVGGADALNYYKKQYQPSYTAPTS